MVFSVGSRNMELFRGEKWFNIAKRGKKCKARPPLERRGPPAERRRFR
jgi:hypothetical protein